ncbi:hypothetical protein KC361_g10 [Hortaea werneckii]|nr:hypothetical protein KC361_g10 [Hortaea werneckii]
MPDGCTSAEGRGEDRLSADTEVQALDRSLMRAQRVCSVTAFTAGIPCVATASGISGHGQLTALEYFRTLRRYKALMELAIVKVLEGPAHSGERWVSKIWHGRSKLVHEGVLTVAVEHVDWSVALSTLRSCTLPVLLRLGLSVVGAVEWVVRAWVEVRSHPVVSTARDGTVVALFRLVLRRVSGGLVKLVFIVEYCLPSRLGQGARENGVVGLVVAVGANDNGLKVLAVVTGVRSRFFVNVRAPQRTLVVGDRGRVRAVAHPATSYDSSV